MFCIIYLVTYISEHSDKKRLVKQDFSKMKRQSETSGY